MYELVYKNDVKFDYCEDDHYNYLPTPYEVITEEEWRKLRYRWANSYFDFKQIMNKEQLQQLFGEDGGYASCYIDYNGEYGVAELIKTKWENGHDVEMRAYVKIGCNHEWECTDSDKFSTTQRCKKCGTVREIPTGM